MTTQVTLRGVGLAALLALATGVLAGPAHAVDTVCPEGWSAADLARGPTAIVSGVLLPLRSLAGGLVFAGASATSASGAALAPVWVLGSTVFGVAEGVWWIGTGVLDTVSGGVLRLAPDAATDLRTDPIVPWLDAEPRDPCP